MIGLEAFAFVFQIIGTGENLVKIKKAIKELINPCQIMSFIPLRVS